MTQPEEAGMPAALLARLLSRDWRERQEALQEAQQLNLPGLARELLQMMRSHGGDLHAFITAMQALERTGQPLTAEVIAMLNDPDLELRVAVPLVLGSLDGPEAAQALVKAAADASQPENVRFNAVEALGSLRAPEALEMLIALLSGGSPYLRYGAAIALGQLQRAEAEPHLLLLLDDPYLAEPALSALAEVGSAQAVPGVTRWMLANLDQAPMAVSTLAAVAAREQAGDEDAVEHGAAVRQVFLETAGAAGQRRVLELTLPGALDFSPNEPIWSALAVVCGWVAENGLPGLDVEARSALARLLADPGARNVAEKALLRLPGPVPLELMDALNSSDADYALSAARVLAASGDPRALPALTALLRRDEEALAAIGAEGLGNLGGPLALAALTEALANPRPYVRRIAVSALVRANAPGLSAQAAALLEHADPGVREAALRLLAQVDPSAGARAAQAACQDPAPEMRRAGVEIAARGAENGEPLGHALELIGAAFSDTDAGTRRAAVQAAAALPESAALPLLARALEHKDGWVRVYAVRGFGQVASRTSDPAVVKTLSVCFLDPFPPVRSAAVQALARRGGLDLPADLREAMRELLRKAQTDESPEVRQSAADALESGTW